MEGLGHQAKKFKFYSIENGKPLFVCLFLARMVTFAN